MTERPHVDQDVLTLVREINAATRVRLVTVMSVRLAGYHEETGTSPGDLIEPPAVGTIFLALVRRPRQHRERAGPPRGPDGDDVRVR
ncbi:hypothetical protein ACWGDX_04695 [Streptomyces sp. NPDC055025]